ncbi:MAG: DHHA1 domain-containing protein, partial [Paracoccaceae bacterium]
GVVHHHTCSVRDHVAQRGSLNDDQKLRFDFSHARALSREEMRAVEAEVNRFIRQNTAVETRVMTPDEARALGAMALFGEKYGDEVRVVSMGRVEDSGKGAARDAYSVELCGGTHVRRTGDIGLFTLVSDSAVASGVRRIEALTAKGALRHRAARDAALDGAAQVLKTRPEDLVERLRALMDERKSLQGEVAGLRRRLALSGGGTAAQPEARNVGGVAFLAQVLTGVNGRDLRGLIDEHKRRLGSGMVLLIADANGRAAIAAGVTDDLVGRLSAVDIVRRAAEVMGGKGGGGRADMAQAGAPDAANADAAIGAVKEMLEE